MQPLKVYKLRIREEDDDLTGVEYVALVDDPAIERNFVAFGKDKQLFKATDTEKRIVTGALLVADLPIYRRDAKMGEYYVIFDSETIKQIVHKFFRKGNVGKVNMMHNPDKKLEGVYMFESFIIDKDRGINVPTGFDELTNGSWMGSYKVDNEEVWQEFIKTGLFKGFSVEGMFDYEEQESQVEEVLQEVINIIQGIEIGTA